MNAIAATSMPMALREELLHLRRYWGWFLLLGAMMVILGTVAISWSCLLTITVMATWLFGIMMVAGGVTEVLSSFSAARWSGSMLHLLIGVLYIVVGFLFIDQPASSAIQLTLVAAVFLMVGGVFRIFSALSVRFHGWQWVLLNGVVTLALGFSIYKHWPASGLWAIGLFVGIEMIFNGWAWIMLAFGLKSVPKTSVA